MIYILINMINFKGNNFYYKWEYNKPRKISQIWIDNVRVIIKVILRTIIFQRELYFIIIKHMYLKFLILFLLFKLSYLKFC